MTETESLSQGPAGIFNFGEKVETCHISEQMEMNDSCVSFREFLRPFLRPSSPVRCHGAAGTAFSVPSRMPDRKPTDVVEYSRQAHLTSFLEPASVIRHSLSKVDLESEVISAVAHGGVPLPEFYLHSMTPRPEKLDTPFSSLLIIRDACGPYCKGSELRNLWRDACHPELRRSTTLKIETPLLRSDNAADLRQYSRMLNGFGEISGMSSRVPLEPADNEIIEDIDFPAAAKQRDHVLMERVSLETLSVDSDALRYLLEVLQPESTNGNQGDIAKEIVAFNGVGFCLSLLSPYMPAIADQSIAQAS